MAAIIAAVLDATGLIAGVIIENMIRDPTTRAGWAYMFTPSSDWTGFQMTFKLGGLMWMQAGMFCDFPYCIPLFVGGAEPRSLGHIILECREQQQSFPPFFCQK